MAEGSVAKAADDDSKKSGGDGIELAPKPKQNSSAFFIFSDEKKREVELQNSGASSAEMQQMLLSKFYSLSPGGRSRYDGLATRDRERYQREITTWEMTRERIRNTPSSTTLFIANFDPRRTTDDDLKKLFQPHEISHMYVRRNIALVNFSSIATAKAARKAANGRVLEGNVVSVSHAVGRRPDQYKRSEALYEDERRAAFKEQNPGWSDIQVDGALQAQYFCRLTEEERARYNKLAFDDNRRFDREMEEWESENRRVTDVAEPPTSSCNCENCERLTSEEYHVVTLPAGDAFTFGNGSFSSSLYQNDGAPRRILRARRPPDVSATQGTDGTDAQPVGPDAAHSSTGTPANSVGPSTDAGTPSGTTTTAARSANTPTSSTNGTTGGIGTFPAPASSPVSTTQRPRARGNAGRSPRVVVPADADNEHNSAGARGNAAGAESDDEEDANVDPNANAFRALLEDSDDEDDQDSNNSSLSDEISLPSSEDGDDDDKDDDDEDEDDDSEGFPLQLLQDMLPGGMGARVAARLMNGGIPGLRQEQLSTNIRPDQDDDSVASSDDEDDTAAAKCCACYRRGDQNHKWRRLVTLPCCGLGGKENSSSTRFCASCVLKLAVTRPDSASSVNEYHFFEDERNEPPVSHFYKENRQSESKRFIECPRCRDILIVKLKNLQKSYATNDDNDESSSGECDCSECRAERRSNREPVEIKTASSISMHRASFKTKAWFVGRKRDNAMILWKAAHLHPSFIPLTALGGDKYRANIMKLVGWGILHKVPGKRNTDIYRMNREDQMDLVKLVSPDPTTETDEQVNKEFDLFLELTHDMGYAGWESIKKFRIDRAIRLLNRFLYLLLYFRRYLPSPPMSLWQEWVVTALNAFNLALVLQFLLITAVYAGLFFGVGVTVCRALRNPEKFRFRSASRWAYVSAILGAYLTYRLSKVLYYSQYINFLGFLSPKAIIPFKKILWG